MKHQTLALLMTTALAGCAGGSMLPQAPASLPAGAEATAAQRVTTTLADPVTALASPDGSERVVTGRVVRLVGPLAAAATKLPATDATPQAGAPVRDVAVVLTDAATGVVSPGAPANRLAVTHTDADGKFTLKVPASYTGSQIGVVAWSGSPSEDGTTSTKLTMARAIVWVGAGNAPSGDGLTNPVTLYLDTLTSDERNAFVTLNLARKKYHHPVMIADTVAQMDARYLAAYQNAHHNTLPANDAFAGIYERLGVSFGIAEDGGANALVVDHPTWSSEIDADGGITGNQTGLLWGLHAIYDAAPCNTKHPTLKCDYFTFASFLSNVPTS